MSVWTSDEAPDPGTFLAVLVELHDEHARATERHGFTDAHDDLHGDQDWAWRILRRVSELMAPPTVIDQSDDDRRRALLEVAHIAASAVASHDRRSLGSPDTEDAGDALARVTAVVASGAPDGETVTSTDRRFRYVARGGSTDDRAERHLLTCDRWQARDVGGIPFVLCKGACAEEVATDAE